MYSYIHVIRAYTLTAVLKRRARMDQIVHDNKHTTVSRSMMLVSPSTLPVAHLVKSRYKLLLPRLTPRMQLFSAAIIGATNTNTNIDRGQRHSNKTTTTRGDTRDKKRLTIMGALRMQHGRLSNRFVRNGRCIYMCRSNRSPNCRKTRKPIAAQAAVLSYDSCRNNPDSSTSLAAPTRNPVPRTTVPSPNGCTQ